MRLLSFFLSPTSSSKFALLLISIILIITIMDSQFIRVFYGTNLGNPGDLQFSLFVVLVLIASIISMLLLRFAKRIDRQAQGSRPRLFRTAFISTFCAQIAIFLISFFVISEMFIFHAYSAIFLLLGVYLSHFLSIIILGMLSAIFLQWFMLVRSPRLLVYAAVFIVFLFLILIALPVLTEQSSLQPETVHPRPYIILIQDYFVAAGSSYGNIVALYDLETYALPILVIASWMLTVLLLKGYSSRIGKKKFWLMVSIPLAYQVFVIVASNPYLVNESFVEIIYSTQVQFLININGQISGLFFAVAFLVVGRKMKRKRMKDFFIISSIGVFSLFSSIQDLSIGYAAYPPFGLVTLVFLGLSSYMLLVGMVGSAAYVSRDSEVRHEVYRGLEKDSEVIKMGLAEMEREVQRRVTLALDNIKSANMLEEMKVNVDPDEEDVQLMIEEVLKEVHSKAPTDQQEQDRV